VSHDMSFLVNILGHATTSTLHVSKTLINYTTFLFRPTLLTVLLMVTVESRFESVIDGYFLFIFLVTIDG